MYHIYTKSNFPVSLFYIVIGAIRWRIKMGLPSTPDLHHIPRLPAVLQIEQSSYQYHKRLFHPGELHHCHSCPLTNNYQQAASCQKCTRNEYFKPTCVLYFNPYLGNFATLWHHLPAVCLKGNASWFQADASLLYMYTRDIVADHFYPSVSLSYRQDH